MHPKRATWSEDSLNAAMAAVARGQLSQRAAAARYNIPRRTLRNHLRTGSSVKRLGRSSILNQDQENDLSKRIIRFADIGVPVTPKVIRRQAFIFCEKYNIKHSFNKDSRIAGKDWLKMFLKRHPEISKRKAQFMNPARAQKLNRPIVTQHFEELKKLYDEFDIENNPGRLYNMDEKGCRLTIHHQQTVLAQKGARRVHLIAPEHAENVTIAMCVNAVGSAIPPMIIFKGQRQKPEFSDNWPPGSIVKMAPKGSMTTELFIEFIKHLAKYKTQESILLIFDGASSHLDYSIVEEADKHNIVLYCLPSNTTHELQPLDKSVNKSFEHHWDQEVMTYMYQNPNRRLTKTSFNTIFTKAWSKSLTHENIVNGFRATGLFPFNPHILPDEAFAPSVLTELPAPQPPTAINESNTYCDDETSNEPVQSRHNADSPSVLNERELDAALTIDTPQQQLQLENIDRITPEKYIDDANRNCVTLIHSPKPYTSKSFKRRPVIFSSDSETDTETNSEHLTQLLLNKSLHTRLHVYSSEEEKEDEIPLANLKSKEPKSPFQVLMPTPNYAVIKNKPRRKAINYKGQRVTKDIFKDLEETKENKKSKKSNQKTTKKGSKQKIEDVKKRQISETDKGKGKSKNTKVILPETSWYCHACKEERLSDMRLCVQCKKWYHEECVGLSKEDNEVFCCPDCD